MKSSCRSQIACQSSVARQARRDAQVQHQQRDRDREDPVAEGDDPRELDLVVLSRRLRVRASLTPVCWRAAATEPMPDRS